MAKMNCARPGCGNPLTKTSQRKYCSTACANVDKSRIRQEELDAARLDSPVVATVSFQGDIKSIRSGVIPRSVEDALVAGIGHHRANVVLSEIEEQIRRSDVQLGVFPDYLRRHWPIYPSAPSFGMSIPRPSLKPPTSHNIEPDTTLLMRHFSDEGYTADIRRSSDITYKDIDRLMKLGPYVLASRIKKGGVMDALTTGRKWDVKCSDAKLRAIIKADLERVLMRYAHDMLLAWDYGAAFGSTIWTQRTAEHIGVERGVGKQTRWYVIDQIEWAHPGTITEILRDTKSNGFRGFIHCRSHKRPMHQAIVPPQALVLTHDGRFGNLWGQSMAEPVYDFAFWYEVVMRGFLNYLQRMGIPVAVCYGPSHGRTRRPDGTAVDNPTYGLLMAGYAAHHSAIYLPSDVDIQTGQPLWRLEYLPADQKGEHFIAALRYLGTQITRGVIVGDRAATQDSETGSYNAASIHNQLTQVDNNFLFMRLLGQLNDFLVIRYAEFNIDANNPPLARLIAQVIGPEEQEIMMKLFATAGNVKIGDGTPLDRVDWEEAFRSIQVPILSEEDREEQRKKRLEEKKEAQEMFQKVQAKSAAPLQPGKNGGTKSGPEQTAQPKPPAQNGKNARLAVLEHLVDGGAVPLLLTPEQVQAIAHPEHERIVLREIEPDGPLDPEFEKKHPRDAHGQFSKKREEGEDKEEDGEKKAEGEEQLDQEPWPGADPEKGIKGIITLDGVEYTVIGNTSKEELLAMHRTNMQMYQRAKEFDYPLEMAPMVVVDTDDHDSISRYFEVSVESVRDAMAENKLLAMYDRQGRVIMDDNLAHNPTLLEPILFHETLHTQPRRLDSDRGGSDRAGWVEETFNTLITMEYGERFGLPVVMGYPMEIGQIAQAAEQLGWSKARLYRYARIAHQIDGPGYARLATSLLDLAGVSQGRYPEALSWIAPDWEKVWLELAKVYRWPDVIEELWR